MSFGPGSIFKHYRIERLIGKGGMGEVYLAEETTLGRKVAIKMLKQEATTDPKFVERFRNEARMLGQLNHPNIVALHTFIEDGGTYYLVMQYAPGITLAELIRRTGPIPEQRAMRIFTQLAEALTFAHSEGIVHRDIKPSNIMIDPDKNDRVLVMDFGIARMMDTQHITGTGTQLGTPCYMSPEQVLGKKDIGPPSDVYSSGVVLYEMLSGSLPYDLESESLYTVQGRIVNEPLPDPRLRYEYISERGVALLKDLTQKEPEKRPKSIADAKHEKGSEYAKPYPVPEPVLDVLEKRRSAAVIHDNPVSQKLPVSEVDVSEPAKPKRKRAGLLYVIGILALGAGILLIALRKTDNSKAPLEPVEMIRVDGGTFMMGSNEYDDEQPVHQVTVSSFYIGKHEITQKEWRDVMGSNPSDFKGDYLPVESITWYDAVEYCNKRSQQEGLTPCYSGSGDYISCNWNANGYRLPTEAEWEFAARGGTQSKGYTYSGSNGIGSVAWYIDNSGDTTHSVGTKSPNELGIYDMSGNVWEWCWDWYGNYASTSQNNPTGATSGSYRVLRGGSWFYYVNCCRVASRSFNDPGSRNYYNGLRVLRATQ
jgi:serine/threonine protein kinase